MLSHLGMLLNCFIRKVSANPPTRVGVTRKYLMQDPNGGRFLIQAQNPKSKIQNPNSKLQTPKSKIQTGSFGAAATKRTKTKLIQNPKSKIQNPKSKIQNPKSKIQTPKSKTPNSKIQNSKLQNPKLQTPKSKTQTARLEFGFWILASVGPGRGAMAMQQMKMYGRAGRPNLA